MTTGVSTECRQAVWLSGQSPAEEQQASVELGTLLLAVLASATLVAARTASHAYPWLPVVQTALGIGGPLVLLGLRHFHPASRGWSDRWLAALIAVWCVWPLMAEWLLRRWGMGESYELVMLVCLQHGALVLSVYSHRCRCQQVACLLGAFLVLFAIVIEASVLVGVLAALYGVLLLWWLMTRYWERIQHARSAVHVTRCLPVRWSVLGLTVGSGVLAAVVFGASGGATYVLRGVMPTSGGDRWHDPFARAGVHDGDAVVAAKEDAMSFGPVESELFLESCMPTLYDMFNDLYGEPVRPRQQQRTVTLTNENVRQMEQHIAQTQRSGREFSVLRRRTEAKQQPLDDRRAPAMLYVVGPVPVHLALESFDTFDGVTWTNRAAVETPPPVRRQTEARRSWFLFRQPTCWPIARTTLQHGAKVINLKTNRVPAPPQFTSVHVDRLDQPDFWGWTDDGMAAMVAREQIPQLTVLHLRSQQVDLQVLREQDFSAALRDVEVVYLQTPTPQDSMAARQAREWISGIPRGWQQVEAVVRRLREDFRLDPDSVACSESGDVMEHFLRKRVGPDYCFATTAALMLRHLGYPTRLVAGFYARQQRFDRLAGQTAVLAEDAHVWVEVRVDRNTWLTIEPTPGYQAPREALTWQRWALLLLRSGADEIARRPVQTVLAMASLAALWLTRWWWLDWLASWIWQLAGLGRAERRMRATVQLLEWRCRWCRRPRPANVTLSQWYGELARALQPDAALTMTRFLRQAERILYSPAAHDASGDEPRLVRQTCQCVARGVTLRALRRADTAAAAARKLAMDPSG